MAPRTLRERGGYLSSYSNSYSFACFAAWREILFLHADLCAGKIRYVSRKGAKDAKGEGWVFEFLFKFVLLCVLCGLARNSLFLVDAEFPELGRFTVQGLFGSFKHGHGHLLITDNQSTTISRSVSFAPPFYSRSENKVSLKSLAGRGNWVSMKGVWVSIIISCQSS
jgi:hypothetical protein